MGVAPQECKINLPPEIQQALPPGVVVYAFDGEIIYHQTASDATTHIPQRVYSLLPVKKNEAMYRRRFTHESKPQNTHLAIEQLHGHLGTVFYFFIPRPKKLFSSGGETLYDTRSFAAVSLSTQQWLWVTDPTRARAVFEGEWKATETFKLKNLNPKSMVSRMDSQAELITQIVMYLRDEMERRAPAIPSGRL